MERGRFRHARCSRGPRRTALHYFPAFPYASYQHAKVEDVRDLFAYLKTLAAGAGKVRDHDVPFPFNIRRNVGIWKLLFMDGKPFAPDAAHSPQWNRGAYLVNSLGHCAECHSPRNFLGGIVAAQRFAGGPNPEGEGWVPNITQKGLGGVEREGYRLFPRDRPDARWRQRRRIDGARDQEHLAIAAGGSRGDRGISQVAAAGRGTAAAEEGKGRREVVTGALPPAIRASWRRGDRHSPLWRRGGARRQDRQRLAQSRRGVAILARRESVAGLGGS